MSPCNIASRTIFCRDNLEILQGINSNCIDLVYLDPPFNTNKKFVYPMTKDDTGKQTEIGYNDIFRKEDVKDEWVQTIKEDHYSLYTFLNSTKEIGKKYNFYYLCYMAIRLIEMQRILKHTGSLCFHCDPLMSHFLKLLLDNIFGEENFNNEIVWGYSTSGRQERGKRNSWAKKHDIILWYTKDHNQFKGDCTLPCTPEYIQSHYRQIDEQGRKCRIRVDAGKERIYYPEEGINGNDWWGDIPYENSMSKRRTKYPTQKPVPLLKRIIRSSTKEGGVVLDPFCGCATTCIAAEILNRRWIGIDKLEQTYVEIRKRLKEEIENPIIADRILDKDLLFLTEPPNRTDTKEKDQVQHKFVYVISHQNYEREYKVGIASNVNSRLNGYQTSDPDRNYKIEHAMFTPHFREIEKHIHNKFDNKHEWVSGSLQEIINEIDTYKPINIEDETSSLFNGIEHN